MKLSQHELIEAFYCYDMGEVEFVELALETGMSRAQINECLIERRSDDEEL